MYMVFGLLGLFGAAIFLILIFVSLFTKKKMKRNLIGFFTCTIVFFVCVSLTPSSSEHPKKSSNTKTEQHDEPLEAKKQEIEADQPSNVEIIELDTSDYMNMDAEVLFEYGNYLGGQKVITVITVENVDTHSNMIKARTSNNSGIFFSVVCEFDEANVVESVEKGSVVTVAGTLQERNPLVDEFSFLETPTASLENCHIIGYGEIASELKSGSAVQREVGAQAKKAYEDQVAAAQKEERDTYISQCKSVKYSDVERNPDNYKGDYIKISGKVVQVAEGWFDTVTMRIESGNGNMWYVTYTRGNGESRILEGDKITCYGECDGVTSYKSVLGSQVTIPSMSMKYYE